MSYSLNWNHYILCWKKYGQVVQCAHRKVTYYSHFRMFSDYSMQKKQQIRNSTTEFLIFTLQGEAEGIEVRLEDDTVWLTQQMMASL